MHGVCYCIDCLILLKADKGDQTGYDIILEKHLNGKFAMKDMIDFFKERQDKLILCTTRVIPRPSLTELQLRSSTPKHF